MWLTQILRNTKHTNTHDWFCMRCASLNGLSFAPIRNMAEVILAEDICVGQSNCLIFYYFSLAFQCMAVKKPTSRRSTVKTLCVYSQLSVLSAYMWKKHLTNWSSRNRLFFFSFRLRYGRTHFRIQILFDCRIKIGKQFSCNLLVSFFFLPHC